MHFKETAAQRESRIDTFARRTATARTDYQKDFDAVVSRTEKLKAERLERDAVIRVPASAKIRKSRKAPKRRVKTAV